MSKYFFEQAKSLMYLIDYDLAKELDEDGTWGEYDAFVQLVDILEDTYNHGYEDGLNG